MTFGHLSSSGHKGYQVCNLLQLIKQAFKLAYEAVGGTERDCTVTMRTWRLEPPSRFHIRPQWSSSLELGLGKVITLLRPSSSKTSP